MDIALFWRIRVAVLNAALCFQPAILHTLQAALNFEICSSCGHFISPEAPPEPNLLR